MTKKVLKQIVAGERTVFQQIYTTDYDGEIEYFDSSFKSIMLDNEILGISIFVKNITDSIVTHRALEDLKPTYLGRSVVKDYVRRSQSCDFGSREYNF